MTKSELANDMARQNNNRRLISRAAVMRYWGRSKAATKELLEGIPCDKTGRDHKYHVLDVAERMVERMSI